MVNSLGRTPIVGWGELRPYDQDSSGGMRLAEGIVVYLDTIRMRLINCTTHNCEYDPSSERATRGVCPTERRDSLRQNAVEKPTPGCGVAVKIRSRPFGIGWE